MFKFPIFVRERKLKSMQICGSLLLAALQHSHYRILNPSEISMHFKSVFFAMSIASLVVIRSSYASDCVPGPNCDACCYANFHICMTKCGYDERMQNIGVAYR
jgi:hypothetical protein